MYRIYIYVYGFMISVIIVPYMIPYRSPILFCPLSFIFSSTRRIFVTICSTYTDCPFGNCPDLFIWQSNVIMGTGGEASFCFSSVCRNLVMFTVFTLILDQTEFYLRGQIVRIMFPSIWKEVEICFSECGSVGSSGWISMRMLHWMMNCVPNLSSSGDFFVKNVLFIYMFSIFHENK